MSPSSTSEQPRPYETIAAPRPAEDGPHRPRNGRDEPVRPSLRDSTLPRTAAVRVLGAAR
ncbi:hypothetical protein [Streptomyces yangpuensis]|uniref:hypothetical protein n=1 Tax=Streptomyces yangpuensis TaxID=1648182 RepID=UPI00365FC0AA